MLLLHFFNAKVSVFFFFTFLLLHFYEHLKFRTIAMNKIKSNINPFVKSGANVPCHMWQQDILKVIRKICIRHQIFSNLFIIILKTVQFPMDHQLFSNISALGFSAKLVRQTPNGLKNTKYTRRGITKVKYFFSTNYCPE